MAIGRKVGAAWAASLALAGGLGMFFAGGAGANSAQPEMEMDPEQMMAMMVEWAKPVKQHEYLKAMVGTWDCETKFWMFGDEPIVGKGMSTSELVLGGRFVTQHFTMPEFMNMPFEGMGAVGYDKAKGKFVSVWMDNFSTGFMSMEGEWDDASKTMTWDGVATYPAGPGQTAEVPVRHVIKHLSPDKMLMEFWEPNPATGEMMKNGEITYTRRH